MPSHTVEAADPFELPDWLGTDEVTWTAETSLPGALVAGSLRCGDRARLTCDLLACDLAHPTPVLAEGWRTIAHRTWGLGEVLLLDYDGRLTLAVPGSTVTAEPALEAVRRLARAVGALPQRFAVCLRL